MVPEHQVLAIFQQIGVPEMIVIGVLALLIFGKRLPEVGRSLGKSFVEFKKGLKDTTDEVRDVRGEADRALKSDDKDDRPKPFNEPANSGAKSKNAG